MNCEKCDIEVSKRQYNNHFISCNGTRKIAIDYNKWHNETHFVCPFCDVQIEKPRSFRSHIWRAHSVAGQAHNPNSEYRDGREAWNKGLTKETSEAVKRNGEGVSTTLQQQITEGTYVNNFPPMSDQQKQDTSERMSLHNPGGRSKWFEVDGIKVQGTYEKQFAESLVSQQIKWERPHKHQLMKYKMANKARSYAPDFYLNDYDLFVEIKGYWWNDDEEKMSTIKAQHQDKKLVVLFGKEKLDDVCEDITKIIQEPLWTW